jgi:hypothetical protein
MSSPDDVVYLENIIAVATTPTTKPATKIIPFKYLIPELFAES